MPLRSHLTTKVGNAYTKVWNKLEGGGSIELIRASDNYDEFDTVLELDGKWFFEDTDPQNLSFTIAEWSEELTDALGNGLDEPAATHIRRGEDVYTIRRGDTKPPYGTRPYWRVFVDEFDRPTRFTSMR